MRSKNHILVIIVLAQFCCTSIWFAGNGVMDNLVSHFQLNESAIGHLTSSVQFGFIVGTLVFARFGISDRFPASNVFFASAIAAALFNGGIIINHQNIYSLLILRFMSGFFLAGIYPVGMKIAADYFDKGLGKSLGFLVGALVLGTAFPHLLKGILDGSLWRMVLVFTSILSVIGGTGILLLVPTVANKRALQPFDFASTFSIFKNRAFRSASFGYFGHMWELYAFWAFVPIMLSTYKNMHPLIELNIALASFITIGIGGISCVMGGFISQFLGVRKTAVYSLGLSAACCLISPVSFLIPSPVIFILFLAFWGMVVVADSPLFSTLVAQNVSTYIKGTALTIVNGIGFTITIISIQLLSVLFSQTHSTVVYAFLAIGPLIGLYVSTSQPAH